MRAQGEGSKPAPDWNKLLVDAVAQPGIISEAYSRFWNYSTGNQLLAMFQCMQRGLPLGPIHTFQGWKQLDRFIKKGEKAITLCMPITVRRKGKRDKLDSSSVQVADGTDRRLTDPPDPGRIVRASEVETATVFTYKPHWFVLAQTEGSEYVPTELPQWKESRALPSMGVERTPFDHPNGNVQGYARGRTVSVSPIAVLPHKTLFHELAHILLGHTEELGKLDDHDLTPVNLREVEAECVALLCCESLELPGAECCRGYIQHWLGTESISDRSAQRIFKAADTILKAGHPAVAQS